MAGNDQRGGGRDRDFERALDRGAPRRDQVQDARDAVADERGLGRAELSVPSIDAGSKKPSVLASAKEFIKRSGLGIQAIRERRSVVRTASSDRVIADAPRQSAASNSVTATVVEPRRVIGRFGASRHVAASDLAARAVSRQPRGLGRLFGPGMDTALGLLALLFTLFVAGWVVKDAIVSRSQDKSGLLRVIAKKWNERTLVFPIEGTDSQGRRALFDVVVLTKDYGWVKGSTTELERGEKRLSAEDIESEVLAPQLREGLGNSRELIAVGLASQEGEVEREEQRGGLRAARIAGWVHGAVDPNIPMWTLNLGRYLEPCAECEEGDTSWQRPFIVIAVRQTDPGTNVSEALKSAMSDKVNLPSPSRYSAWAMAKYQK